MWGSCKISYIEFENKQKEQAEEAMKAKEQERINGKSELKKKAEEDMRRREETKRGRLAAHPAKEKLKAERKAHRERKKH